VLLTAGSANSTTVPRSIVIDVAGDGDRVVAVPKQNSTDDRWAVLPAIWLGLSRYVATVA
jgi:hypothetical protein